MKFSGERKNITVQFSNFCTKLRRMIIFIKESGKNDVPWYFNFRTKNVCFFFSLFFLSFFPPSIIPDTKTIGEVEVNIIPHLHVVSITNQTDEGLIL